MKIWKIILLIVLLGVITIPLISIIQFIQKFNELGEIEVMDDNTPLNFSFIEATNIRTQKTDTINLSDLLLINFWASWCKPCIEEQPSLEKMSANYPQIKFIQLSFDDINKQKRIVDSLKWRIPAYYLDDTTKFNKPGILPMTLLTRDSTVLRQWYGSINWQDTSITNFINRQIVEQHNR